MSSEGFWFEREKLGRLVRTKHRVERERSGFEVMAADWVLGKRKENGEVFLGRRRFKFACSSWPHAKREKVFQAPLCSTVITVSLFLLTSSGIPVHDACSCRLISCIFGQ